MRGIGRISAAAAAVFAVLLAGCTGDESAQAGSPTAPAYLQVTPGTGATSPSLEPSPSSPPTTPPSPEPSPAAPSEPVEGASPPQIQPVQGTPGEPYDPRQVYDAVVVELNKLLVNPDPDQLELTVSRECDCYQNWYDFFANLRTAGERYAEGDIPNLPFFQVKEQTTSSFVAYIVEQSDGSAVIDARTLEPIRDPGTREPEAKELTLVLDDGVWRIRQLRYLVDEEGQNLGLRLAEGAPTS